MHKFHDNTLSQSYNKLFEKIAKTLSFH